MGRHQPHISPNVGGGFTVVCHRCGQRLAVGIFDPSACPIPPAQPTIYERDAQIRRALRPVLKEFRPTSETYHAKP